MAIKDGTLHIDGSIQMRGGTAAALKSVNPLLARREIMVEIETGKIKIGDGKRRWNELNYLGVPVEESISIILTASDISQKYIALPDDCNVSEKITLTIQSFPTERDIDWEISENKITWKGLGLEGIAQAGDKICVFYYKN